MEEKQNSNLVIKIGETRFRYSQLSYYVPEVHSNSIKIVLVNNTEIFVTFPSKEERNRILNTLDGFLEINCCS